jgi:hypothetical protein
MNTIEKTKELTGLLVKLDKSIALKEFMPDAFDFGPCKVQVIANAFKQNPKIRFILGNGVMRVFPSNEVPENVKP